MARLTDSKVFGNLETTGDLNTTGVLRSGTSEIQLTTTQGYVRGLSLESSIAGNILTLDAGVLNHQGGAGYQHIPSGGTSGDILKWAADGTAVWEEESGGGIDLTPQNNAFIVGTSSEWQVKTGSDVRDAAGLGTNASVTFNNLTVSTDSTVGNNFSVGNITTVNSLTVNGAASLTSTLTVDSTSNLATVNTTGNVTMGSGSGTREINIDKGTGSNSYLNFRSSGNRRWQINVTPDNDAEFVLNECSVSTGNVTSAALSISRAGSGQINLNRNIDVSGTITAGTADIGITDSTGYVLGTSLHSSIAGSGIDLTAGVLSHTTGSGWNHIPSDGTAGQILRWTSSGDATWGADSDTLGGLTPTNTGFVIGNGTSWNVQTGSNVRDAAGLGTANSPQFTGLTLTGNASISGTLGVGNTLTVERTTGSKLVISRTSATSSALTLVADSNQTRLLSAASDGSSTARAMVFVTGQSARMTITSTGAVGVGVTSPTEQLHCSGRIATDVGFTVKDGGTAYHVIDGDRNFSGGSLTLTSSATINNDGGNNNVQIKGSTDDNLFRTDASNDRIGIGTNSPGEQLDQSGNFRTRGAGVAVVNSGNSSVTVTFPLAFNSTPCVVCTPNWGTTVHISSISSTSFTATFGTTPMYTQALYWHAFRRHGD